MFDSLLIFISIIGDVYSAPHTYFFFRHRNLVEFIFLLVCPFVEKIFSHDAVKSLLVFFFVYVCVCVLDCMHVLAEYRFFFLGRLLCGICFVFFFFSLLGMSWIFFFRERLCV
jgi:hypothetical protein